MGGVRHVEDEHACRVARAAEEDLEREERAAVVEAALVAGGVDVAVHAEPGVAAVPADELEVARVALGGAPVLEVDAGHSALLGGLGLRAGSALGLRRRAGVDGGVGCVGQPHATSADEQQRGSDSSQTLGPAHPHRTTHRRRTPSNAKPPASAAPANPMGTDAPVVANWSPAAAGGCALPAGAGAVALAAWVVAGLLAAAVKGQTPLVTLRA